MEPWLSKHEKRGKICWNLRSIRYEYQMMAIYLAEIRVVGERKKLYRMDGAYIETGCATRLLVYPKTVLWRRTGSRFNALDGRKMVKKLFARS